MIFKTHQSNIAQIRACVEAYGVCFFHGCGNMYADEKESDFRKNFTNPKSDESSYRIKFMSVDQVPETLDELNTMLLGERNKEIMGERASQETAGVKTLTVKKQAAEGSNLSILGSDSAESEEAAKLKADQDKADEKSEAEAKKSADKAAKDAEKAK